jgi:hypothetical protein
MRDLFKKVMTGSLVAGAALFVTACGGGESAAENNTAGNITDEGLMNTGDMTGVDAANAVDANLGIDANMTGSTGTMGNTTSTDTTVNTTTTTTDVTTNTGTGTGNTTGM